MDVSTQHKIKRQAVRHKGEIPLEVKQGFGLTRDFSAYGLFFVTDQPVTLGEQLELKMLLGNQEPGQRVRVRYQAHVVRVEPEKGKMGVAVAITGHEFEPMSEAFASYPDSRKTRFKDNN